jgi:hypothetical protein
VSARRPVRTQKIAYHETPLNAANPDIDARIGWLLGMSRLHHIDEAFQDGRHFAQALADAGVPASRSLLSRWESGEIPISYERMSAYEVALGLEVGQISSITGYIKASIPGLKTRVVRPKLDPDSRAFAERLDELIDITNRRSRWFTCAVRSGRCSAADSSRSRPGRSRSLPAAEHGGDEYGGQSSGAGLMVAAIAQSVSDPAVHVITTPAGLRPADHSAGGPADAGDH